MIPMKCDVMSIEMDHGRAKLTLSCNGVTQTAWCRAEFARAVLDAYYYDPSGQETTDRVGETRKTYEMRMRHALEDVVGGQDLKRRRGWRAIVRILCDAHTPRHVCKAMGINPEMLRLWLGGQHMPTVRQCVDLSTMARDWLAGCAEVDERRAEDHLWRGHHAFPNGGLV